MCRWVVTSICEDLAQVELDDGECPGCRVKASPPNSAFISTDRQRCASHRLRFTTMQYSELLSPRAAIGELLARHRFRETVGWLGGKGPPKQRLARIHGDESAVAMSPAMKGQLRVSPAWLFRVRVEPPVTVLMAAGHVAVALYAARKRRPSGSRPPTSGRPIEKTPRRLSSTGGRPGRSPAMPPNAATSRPGCVQSGCLLAEGK
jgi:hypothetical protein